MGLAVKSIRKRCRDGRGCTGDCGEDIRDRRLMINDQDYYLGILAAGALGYSGV